MSKQRTVRENWKMCVIVWVTIQQILNPPHLPLQVVYSPALWLWSWPCVLLFQWYVWEYDKSRSLKYTNMIGFPFLHISFSSWMDSGGHWPKENERYLEQTGSNLQLEAKPSPAQPILYQSQANCRHMTKTKYKTKQNTYIAAHHWVWGTLLSIIIKVTVQTISPKTL